MGSTNNRQLLNRVVGSLFPDKEEDADPPLTPRNGTQPVQWSEEWEVTAEEMTGAVRRMSERNAAPGPDGLPRKVIALAYRVVGSRIRRLFTRCLQEG